jgi:hypothetical protein
VALRARSDRRFQGKLRGADRGCSEFLIRGSLIIDCLLIGDC